jgi:hypothetical protein
LSLGLPRQPPIHNGSNVKLQITAKKDFAEQGKSGTLYVLADESNYEAYFLQDDGQLFTVDRDENKKPTIIAPVQ